MESIQDDGSSHVGGSPGSVWGVSWIEIGWVRELTIMVLLLELGNDGLANSDEVLHVLLVGNVGVEVVLEMLNHVHVLLDLVESSDSWEGEGLIEELPSVNRRKLFFDFLGDFDSVVVVLDVELAGKLVHLPVHLLGALPESLGALALGCGGSVNDARVLGVSEIEHLVIFTFAGLRITLSNSSHTVGLDDLNQISSGLSV